MLYIYIYYIYIYEQIFPHILIQMIDTGYCFHTDHALCQTLYPS